MSARLRVAAMLVLFSAAEAWAAEPGPQAAPCDPRQQSLRGLHLSLHAEGPGDRAVLEAMTEALVEHVASVSSAPRRRKEKGRTEAEFLERARDSGVDYALLVKTQKKSRGRVRAVGVLMCLQSKEMMTRWSILDRRFSGSPGEMGRRAARAALEFMHPGPQYPQVARPALARAGGGASPAIRGETVAALQGAADVEAAVAEQVVTGESALVQEGLEPVALAIEPGAIASDDPFASAGAEFAGPESTSFSSLIERATTYEFGQFTLRPGGELAAELFTYRDRRATRIGGDRVEGRGELSLSLGATLESERSTTRVRARFRRDFYDPRRDSLAPMEASFSANLGWLSVLLGLTTVSWGRATLTNPADVLNAGDSRDFLTREKLPNLMARVGARLGAVKLEVYHLPFFRAERFDLPTGVSLEGDLVSPNRWVNGDLPTTTEQGVPVTYLFAPGAEPGLRFEPLQFAGRLGLSVSGIDAAFTYARLIDPFPTLIQTVQSSEAEIVISNDVRYLVRNVFAADAEFSLGSFRLLGEVAAFFPVARDDDTNAGTLPQLKALVGAEHKTPDFFSDHHMRFFVELLHTRSLGRPLFNEEDNPNYALNRARMPFPVAAFARATYDWGANLRFSVVHVMNVGQFLLRDPARSGKRGLDAYVRPEVEVELWQHVTAEVGADLFLGDPKELFGSFRHNTRLSVFLSANL